jgi:signal transduction histidine kinase
MTQTPDHSDTKLNDSQVPLSLASLLAEQTRLGKLSMEVSIALTRRETLREMLTACTDALVHHLDAAFARIWIVNEEENLLHLQASSGMYTHLNGQHARVPVGSLKIGLIAAERKPHLTNAVIGDPRVGNQEWARREGMVAFAGYPLLVEERLIGVMALFARRTLDDVTLQAMAAIANGIALGVERLRIQEERARLLVREQAVRQEAENAHQHLHELLMQAPAIICVLRGENHIFELANPGYLQIVGQRELIGKPIREALSELEGQGLFELLDQVYSSGEPFIGNEVKVALDRYFHGTLEEGYFNFVYQPTRNAAGQVDGILVHAVEVTEQVQARETIQRSQERMALSQQALQELNATLETRVAERTEALGQLNVELQRSNQELQDFAYVASHDLQEPLRKIQAFGNLLEEEYGQALGDGKSYLDRMRNAAGRMRTLIDDLLTFSRVTTKAEPFLRVDLGQIVRQVIDDVEPRLKSTQGSITVGDLPTIEADPRQMYQMFQNLISNALKFHQPAIPPVVTISATIQANAEEEPSTAGQLCQLFIEDNGIGFDEKYLDRIFTVFQRLHGRDGYEGTGVGLAVVRKIVERHGGMVTARSRVGEGTTFIVTLPVLQQSIGKERTII